MKRSRLIVMGLGLLFFFSISTVKAQDVSEPYVGLSGQHQPQIESMKPVSSEALSSPAVSAAPVVQASVITNLPAGVTLEDFPLNLTENPVSFLCRGYYNYQEQCVRCIDPWPLTFQNIYPWDVCGAIATPIRFFPTSNPPSQQAAVNLAWYTWTNKYVTNSTFGVAQVTMASSDTLTDFGPFTIVPKAGDLVIGDTSAWTDLPLPPQDEFPWFDQAALDMANRSFNCAGDPLVCTAPYYFFGDVSASPGKVVIPDGEVCFPSDDNNFSEWVTLAFPAADSMIRYYYPEIAAGNTQSLVLPGWARTPMVNSLNNALANLQAARYTAAINNVRTFIFWANLVINSAPSSMPAEDLQRLQEIVSYMQGAPNGIYVCLMGQAPSPPPCASITGATNKEVMLSALGLFLPLALAFAFIRLYRLRKSRVSAG